VIVRFRFSPVRGSRSPGIAIGPAAESRPCNPKNQIWDKSRNQARNDGIDLERASAMWSTSSFTPYHGQLLSLAVQWGVAIEIERAISRRATSTRFC